MRRNFAALMFSGVAFLLSLTRLVVPATAGVGGPFAMLHGNGAGSQLSACDPASTQRQI